MFLFSFLLYLLSLTRYDYIPCVSGDFLYVFVLEISRSQGSSYIYFYSKFCDLDRERESMCFEIVRS
ncbi:hypothetical protein AMTRI_Chr08g210110 [Amborella trichopoda]